MLVNKNEIVKYLKKIFLDGKVGEVVFDKSFEVSAASIDSSVIIAGRSGFPLSERIGVYDLGLLIKLLSQSIVADEIVMDVEKNRVVFGNKDEGKVSYLLSDVDVISTNVKNKGGTQAMLDEFKSKLSLHFLVPQNFMENYKRLYGLLRPSYVMFKVKDGVVTAVLGAKIEHNAELKVYAGESVEGEFSIMFDAALLDAVLKNCDFSVEIWLGENSPMVVLNGDVMYGVSPVEGIKVEEKDGVMD